MEKAAELDEAESGTRVMVASAVEPSEKVMEPEGPAIGGIRNTHGGCGKGNRLTEIGWIEG